MLVIPAIDLMDGACVRLSQGDPRTRVTYSQKPAEVAERFAAEGATRLHVVDLDGALAGHPKNEAALREILESDLEVELGGGLRDLRSIEHVLGLGVHAVVLGTAAVEKLALVSEACRLFPGRVCVAVDVRAGKVAVGGWAAGSTLAAFEVGWRAKQAGASWIEYTDVARDGGFTGVDHAGAAQLQKDSGLPVIAAGGVKDLGDVRRCRDAGLAGVIVGKALYEGKLSLAEAVALGRGP